MHPILLKLGPITIYSYGALLALGAALGLWLSGRLARRDGLPADKIQSLAIWAVVAGLIGSRLAYVLIEWPLFAKYPWRAFSLWDGGLVFYGGLICGGLVAYWYIRRHKLPALRVLDCLAPAVVLGQFFGRLGCFSAGCCYGKPHEGCCSVIFNDPNTLAPAGIPLHPTQLYTAVALLLILGALFFIWSRRRFAGQVLFSYGLMHGVARIVIEQFRADWRGAPLLPGVTPTMVFAAVLALGSALALVVLFKRSRTRKD